MLYLLEDINKYYQFKLINTSNFDLRHFKLQIAQVRKQW